jgi:hypothetical protein
LDNLDLPTVVAIFRGPEPSSRSLMNLAWSSRSRCNRVATLSYICPLKDLPSPGGGFGSVDSHLICLAVARRHGVGFDDVRSDARRALDGARLGNGIFAMLPVQQGSVTCDRILICEGRVGVDTK